VDEVRRCRRPPVGASTGTAGGSPGPLSAAAPASVGRGGGGRCAWPVALLILMFDVAGDDPPRRSSAATEDFSFGSTSLCLLRPVEFPDMSPSTTACRSFRVTPAWRDQSATFRTLQSPQQGGPPSTLTSRSATSAARTSPVRRSDAGRVVGRTGRDAPRSVRRFIRAGVRSLDRGAVPTRFVASFGGMADVRRNTSR
jgi:hypothetical protein